ncbi:MAG: hypothetical protein HY271_03925 [Deltaproteobacteria bacterium]|nr:hypothetical protein [Deltaproteobacteria bacterium]
MRTSVLPKDLRERFGITTETEVEFREERGKLMLLKKSTRSAIAKLRGRIKRIPLKAILTAGAALRMNGRIEIVAVKA